MWWSCSSVDYLWKVEHLMYINQFDKSFILGQSAQKQKGVTRVVLVFYF